MTPDEKHEQFCSTWSMSRGAKDFDPDQEADDD